MNFLFYEQNKNIAQQTNYGGFPAGQNLETFSPNCCDKYLLLNTEVMFGNIYLQEFRIQANTSGIIQLQVEERFYKYIYFLSFKKFFFFLSWFHLTFVGLQFHVRAILVRNRISQI